MRLHWHLEEPPLTRRQTLTDLDIPCGSTLGAVGYEAGVWRAWVDGPTTRVALGVFPSAAAARATVENLADQMGLGCSASAGEGR